MADDATQGRLEQELARLQEERDRRLQELGGEDPDDAVDGAVGDTGDAATQLEGLDDVSRTNRRIAEIERLLADPDARTDPSGATTATLRFPDGDEATFRIVGITAEAADDEQDEVITADSPLGQALAGASAGDTVTYAGPDGELSAEVVALG